MNVYDFDKTVYDGDSTIDYFKYCLKNYPKTVLCLPKICFFAIIWKLGLLSTEQFKSKFYSFLKYVPSTSNSVDAFWKENNKKIKQWYLNQKEDEDLIISASPEFIVLPAAKMLNVKAIASVVDINGKGIVGPNCKGQEKIIRFKAEYGDAKINKFYSDSYSDSPLASLAKESFIVSKDTIEPWEEDHSDLKKGIYIMLMSSFMTCFGQVFWKLSSARINLFLVLGFCLYALGALLMIKALKYGELSVLHPILGAGYIISIALGALLFKEAITIAKVIGVLIIVLGLILISSERKDKI